MVSTETNATAIVGLWGTLLIHESSEPQKELTVAGLVPGKGPFGSLSDDQPLREDDPGHGKDALDGQHANEAKSDKAIEQAKAIPGVLEETEAMEVYL